MKPVRLITLALAGSVALWGPALAATGPNHPDTQPVLQATPWPGDHVQCVPFARQNSGIELTGNAHVWWAAAAGLYERGARPEIGSVLTFRPVGRMRLGHVAVVSRLLDSRTIEVDHANWVHGIQRAAAVIDVSAGNDWTAVRVAHPGTGTFGSVYPTYGFIYDRAAGAIALAGAGVSRDAPPVAEEIAEDAERTETPRRRLRRHASRQHRYSWAGPVRPPV